LAKKFTSEWFKKPCHFDEGESREGDACQPTRLGTADEPIAAALTGTSLQLIPYRGAGPAMTDLLAEPVDLMVSQAAVGLPNLQAGTIKPIANLSPRRSQAVPEIPSSDESGVPGLYAEQQRPEGLAALHKAEIENGGRSSSQPTSKPNRTSAAKLLVACQTSEYAPST
jgi:hypothetical protein